MSCSKLEIEASQNHKGYNTEVNRRAGRKSLLRGELYLLGGNSAPWKRRRLSRRLGSNNKPLGSSIVQMQASLRR